MTIVDGTAYALRPAAPRDLPAAAELLRRYDTAVAGFAALGEEDLRRYERMPRFDFDRDSWVAERDGRMAAFGLAWRADRRAVNSFAVVDPVHTGRGLGSRWLGRAEGRAGELLGGDAGVLRSIVVARDDAARRLHARRGYRVARRRYTMHRPLPAPAATPPPGVRARTADERDIPLLHALVEDVFADHSERVPVPYEEFEAELLARADTDPGLWLIAEAGVEPAGVLIGRIEGGTGWVADLGVRVGWRCGGIGRYLLHRAFDEFARRGAVEAALGVDADDETGALHLYRSAGMSVRKHYEIFELPIGR